MVAYSFKKRFVVPIRIGLGLPLTDLIAARPEIPMPHPDCLRSKRQTIRADRKRHARPGEELQHYCGMRTKHCFLIGKARCIEVQPIEIKPASMVTTVNGRRILGTRLDEFARDDGFEDTADMRLFWLTNHPGVDNFEGVLIKWEPLT